MVAGQQGRCAGCLRPCRVAHRPLSVSRKVDESGNRNARLRILLHDAAPVPVNCPRLCTLMRRFSDAMAIWQTTEAARSADDPLLVVDRQHALRRPHHASSRSVLITDDPIAVRPLHERLAQIHEASVPAVASTVLGL